MHESGARSVLSTTPRSIYCAPELNRDILPSEALPACLFTSLSLSSLWRLNSQTNLVILCQLRSKVKCQPPSAQVKSQMSASTSLFASSYCAEAELPFHGRPFLSIREGGQPPASTFFCQLLPVILSVHLSFLQVPPGLAWHTTICASLRGVAHIQQLC